ncbi:hypothetical protein E2C01_086237 [Portunus trituberculatus]|uniref:Uncharacterized protein n=1 Tax=Portunus trituberculatus TaxID=210409 RepID=A0A5B7J947_PORTR|nr:hypothetical protein [Portunus trituberculatus]
MVKNSLTATPSFTANTLTGGAWCGGSVRRDAGEGCPRRLKGVKASRGVLRGGAESDCITPAASTRTLLDSIGWRGFLDSPVCIEIKLSYLPAALASQAAAVALTALLLPADGFRSRLRAIVTPSPGVAPSWRGLVFLTQ